jgi:hypothetical protein
MSKVKIQGNASGTGVVTLTAPNTSTDRTITLPDATATIATTTDVAARLPSITDDGNSAITIQNGAIGIGVTPEAWNASYEAIQLGSKGFIWDVGDEFYVGSNAHFDSAWKYTTTAEASQIKQQDGRLVFANAASGSADAAITFTDRFEITADGRGLSQFTAKAWCNINGTGTPAFKDSHNCSSLTDVGTGQYRVNFTNNMASDNYAGVITGNTANNNYGLSQFIATQLAASALLYHLEHAVHYDTSNISFIAFGD